MEGAHADDGAHVWNIGRHEVQGFITNGQVVRHFQPLQVTQAQAARGIGVAAQARGSLGDGVMRLAPAAEIDGIDERRRECAHEFIQKEALSRAFQLAAKRCVERLGIGKERCASVVLCGKADSGREVSKPLESLRARVHGNAQLLAGARRGGECGRQQAVDRDAVCARQTLQC